MIGMNNKVITDEQAQFFRDNGYLILRDVLRGAEFERVRAAADELTRIGIAGGGEDYRYGKGHKTGANIFRRVEYVIDKRDECKVLLGNPFILRSVERLMGADLIPTWDSMVVKLPGEGIVVPWHRDAGTEQVGDQPIFNVDFYLDEADEDTCVWTIPGSHKWSDEQVQDFLTARPNGFSTDDAVPALMQPGDVMFHDILVVHGSPANASDKLRRVIYYEFRTAHVENEIGPHTREYIPLKQKVLLKCLELRKHADHIPSDQVAYQYHPPAPFNTVSLAPGEELPTFRYTHEKYWRA